MSQGRFVAKSQGGSSNYTPAPAGTHSARCIQVVDLGTQKSEYKGKVTQARKVRFVFELVDEKHVFDETKGEQPFVVGKEFTLSVGDKSALKPVIEAWRGKKLTEQEKEQGVDLAIFLGKPALVSIVHEKSKTNDKIYANISGISSVLKGMQVAKSSNPELLFFIGDEKQFEVFEQLPEFVKEKIKASPEFQDEMVKNIEGGTAEEEAPWGSDVEGDDDPSF